MTSATLSVIQPRTPVGWTVSILLAAWLAAAVLASVNDLSARSAWMMPVLMAAPFIVFASAWYLAPAFRRWALDLDQRFLILLHTLRALGLGFVMLHFHDVLPAVFAFPAGLGDALTAAWALLLGAALYRGAPVGRKAIYAWNTFGLLDFIAAVSLGFASRGVPHGLIAEGVNTDPMGLFPLSLVPLFGVPLFAMTHMIIYAQLRR